MLTFKIPIRGDTKMKKIMAIALILLVGLFILGGCSSTEQQATGSEGNANQEPQQAQQQAGTDRIPEPPALPGE